MPATYEPIASVTLGSDNVTAATFSSIPATYTDLVLVMAGAMDTNHASILCRVNGDTASNYSGTYLAGEFSTSTVSSRESNLTFMRLGAAINYGSPADEQFTIVSHFMSYANTSVNKTVLSAPAQSMAVARIVDLWRSTSAITQIQVYHPVAKFRSGFRVSLYGIKAA